MKLAEGIVSSAFLCIKIFLCSQRILRNRLKFSGNLSIDLNGYIIRIITIRIKTIKERVVYERVNSLSADV